MKDLLDTTLSVETAIPEMHLERHEPDEIHDRLKAAVEVEIERYLWIPADAIKFKPALLPTWYGDGRALFTVGTLNQRPAFWIVRGDSSWETGSESEAPGDAPDFGDMLDGATDHDILDDIEEHFGRAQCSYCGCGLSSYANGPPADADCGKEGCEAAEEVEAGCGWPSIDYHGGCHWGRMDWPEQFVTVKHQFAWAGNLLAAGAC